MVIGVIVSRRFMKTISLLLLLCAAAAAADIRLGIIGTDTLHVVVFTQMFNDAAAAGPRARSARGGGL